MVENFVKQLQSDKELFQAFKDNIAMSFKDETARYKKKNNKKSLSKQDIHIIANNAANDFLTLLCK